MATGTSAPIERRQYFDNDGVPLAGGKIWYYRAGLPTLATVYQDAGLTTAHSNPVILDSAGRAAIFLAPGAYDVQVHKPDDSLLYATLGIVAVAAYTLNDTIDGLAGENLAKDAAVFLSDGSGGRTAGAWYMMDADATATSTDPELVGIVVATSITVGVRGSIRIGGRAINMTGPLTAGSKYYASATTGAITTSAPSNARLLGVADSTTSLVLSPQLASIPASRVSAGTFGAGNYAITGLITVSGTITGNALVATTNVLVGDGLVATPSMAFSADLDTGFYRTGANGFAAVAGGVEHMRWVSNATYVRDGNAGAPAVAFLADVDTGWFRTGSDGIGIAAGGVEQVRWVGTQTLVPNGSVSGPSLSFLNDVQSGFYRKASNVIGGAIAGADVITLGAGALSLLAALFGTSVISPTALTAATTTSNWAPTGFSTALVVRANVSDVFDPATLDGLAGGVAGRLVVLFNINTAQPIKLLNEGSLSTAANRFVCGEVANSSYVRIPPQTGVILWYDGTSSRWRVLSSPTLVG